MQSGKFKRRLAAHGKSWFFWCALLLGTEACANPVKKNSYLPTLKGATGAIWAAETAQALGGRTPPQALQHAQQKLHRAQKLHDLGHPSAAIRSLRSAHASAQRAMEAARCAALAAQCEEAIDTVDDLCAEANRLLLPP